MSSNATLTQPDRERLLEAEDLYRQLMQVIGRDLGLSDWGSKVNHVSFSSGSEYAHTLQNQGAGGHLNVPGELAVASNGDGTQIAKLTVSGNLTVEGNATIDGTLSAGASTLASLAVTGNATVGGTLGVTGATTLSSTLSVSGNTTIGGTLGVTGAVGFSSTLGVTGLLSANGGLTTTTLTATGNVALGNENTDTLTVIAATTIRNAANTATQLFVDPGNNRVIVGTATALGSDTTPNLQVVGRLYVAPESANDSAIQVRRSSAATVGWTFGVDANNDLAFKDDSDTERVRFGDGSSARQLVVTGNQLTTGTHSVTGLLDGSAAVFGAGALSGSETFRVVGDTRLEGTVTITGSAAIGNDAADLIRFYNGTLTARQTVTGSRAGGAALTNLLGALATFGLIVDSTTA